MENIEFTIENNNIYVNGKVFDKLKFETWIKISKIIFGKKFDLIKSVKNYIKINKLKYNNTNVEYDDNEEISKKITLRHIRDTITSSVYLLNDKEIQVNSELSLIVYLYNEIHCCNITINAFVNYYYKL